MDTFIVRIYRLVSDPAQGPAGTVECVGCGERVGFIGGEELFQHLLAAEAHAHERDPPDDGDETAGSR